MDSLTTADRGRFNALLEAMAAVFTAEDHPGGDEAAAALRDCKARPWRRLAESTHLEADIHAALNHPGADPLAQVILEAMDLIPWHYSGLSDGRIRPEIARAMATTYLIGPDGAIQHDDVYSGLFFQSAGLDYPVRTHAAEETFYVVSGVADWKLGDAPAAPRPPGSYVQHPSYAPHASITGAGPVLAAWRWTGRIGMQFYELKG